jgi:hypothetical protein
VSIQKMLYYVEFRHFKLKGREKREMKIRVMRPANDGKIDDWAPTHWTIRAISQENSLLPLSLFWSVSAEIQPPSSVPKHLDRHLFSNFGHSGSINLHLFSSILYLHRCSDKR